MSAIDERTLRSNLSPRHKGPIGTDRDRSNSALDPGKFVDFMRHNKGKGPIGSDFSSCPSSLIGNRVTKLYARDHLQSKLRCYRALRLLGGAA